MKRLVVLGVLLTAFAVAADAQAPDAKQPARRGKAATATAQEGHETPKQQPETAAAPTAPTGVVQLGTVHLAKDVKANGQPLKAGTYQLRLTTEDAGGGDDKGATAGLERWVEFLQRGQVKGREVATIIPQAEIKDVQKDTPPAPNTAKVQLLKGGDFVRVWVNKGGNHYLVHLPVA